MNRSRLVPIIGAVAVSFTALVVALSFTPGGAPQTMSRAGALRTAAEARLAHEAWADNLDVTLPIWNAGADYGPTLQARIDALPSSGGLITIPAGSRYNITTQVNIPSGVHVRANALGDVVLHGSLLTDDTNKRMLSLDSAVGASIRNLILIGEDELRVAAVAGMAKNSTVENNVLVDWEYGIYISTSAAWDSSDVTVSNNNIFSGGYYSLRINGYRGVGSSCEGVATRPQVVGNVLADCYQGISVLCANHGSVINNYSTNTGVIGLRLETTTDTLVRGNTVYDVGTNAFILYAWSSRNRIENNVFVEGNRVDLEWHDDCWDAQTAIENAYAVPIPADEPLRYRVFDQEAGEYIYRHLWCQSTGKIVELRNECNDNVFSGNVFGRYLTAEGTPAAWDSDYDVQVSWFPQLYANSSAKLSRRNMFTGNIFAAGAEGRIRDRGCDNVWSDNVTHTGASVAPVSPIPRACSCPGGGTCNPCNNDGICDIDEGETRSLCGVTECGCIAAYGSGSREAGDVCCGPPPVVKTEDVYPRPAGCAATPDYSGSFVCSRCPDGACNHTETECNCPGDCDDAATQHVSDTDPVYWWWSNSSTSPYILIDDTNIAPGDQVRDWFDLYEERLARQTDQAAQVTYDTGWLVFSGAQQWALAEKAPFSASSAWTLAAVIEHTGTTGMLLSGDGDDVMIYFSAAETIQVRIGGTNVASAPIAAGPRRLVITYDAGTVAMHVDGVSQMVTLTGGAIPSVTPTITTLRYGSHSAGGSSYLTARLRAIITWASVFDAATADALLTELQ